MHRGYGVGIFLAFFLIGAAYVAAYHLSLENEQKTSSIKTRETNQIQEKQAEEAPGTVISADKEGIRVACGKNVLVLQEVQLEGKKRMEADAFLRGYQLKPGDMFKDSRE